MAPRKRGGQQRPVKGLRPGKEPAHLKKQRAKAQLGSDASWLEKQTVEAVAGRSPREVRSMLQRWSLGLIVAATLLAVSGVFLYAWATAAGIVVHVVAAVLAFLAYRLRKHGSKLVEMAESLR
jgi:hypothetical protein